MTESFFWSNLDRTSGASCWQWLGGTINGYGTLLYDGRQKYAHRLSWELTNGEIPRGMHVCHHCDNPGCCNTGHLFLGTQADNLRDMHIKGRYRKAWTYLNK